MNILRSFARPMLAAPFIVDGLDALVRPSRHVEKSGPNRGVRAQ